MAEDENRYHEPPTTIWREPSTYDARLREVFLDPLDAVYKETGGVPESMQIDVLRRLHWYFTVDRRARAPTAALGPSDADNFHACVGAVMRHIAEHTIETLKDPGIGEEVRQALRSYHDVRCCSPALVVAYDRQQQLLGLSYFVHGQPPEETWLVDGKTASLAYQKYRGCRYFHRVCFRQRIAWLPVADAETIEFRLDGTPHPIVVESAAGKDALGSAADTVLQLAAVCKAFLPGKGGRRGQSATGVPALKARALRAVARLPIVRARFRDAWVFVDRHENADDNAEHLYRWVRANHPEINAWFLLDRSSPDWPRLLEEGFRLMPPGLGSKLLILNSSHIISSHADYVFGGLDRASYGPMMGWCYTFLQHGTTKDDVSSWLGPREFDRFVTSSPAEQASIIADDSNYPYTAREVRLTGMPRHDELIRLSGVRRLSPSRTLLVMPTWRGGAFEENANGRTAIERRLLFAETEYARAWSSLLRNAALHDALAHHGWRMIFMPHMNSLPFLDVFDSPPAVEVVSVLQTRIQEVLVDAGAFLTDYTSVAFDMALLRKPVFYYQFDRKFFFAGGHNWRPGYYDYDRHGFGPVAFSERELVSLIAVFLETGGQLAPEYRARMERAMPMNDQMACRRTYESIIDLKRIYRG